MSKLVSAVREYEQRQSDLHLIQFRKLEFQFISSILGILQYALKFFGPIIVLDPVFKLLSFPLVTVRFRL